MGIAGFGKLALPPFSDQMVAADFGHHTELSLGFIPSLAERQRPLSSCFV